MGYGGGLLEYDFPVKPYRDGVDDLEKLRSGAKRNEAILSFCIS
jgi:hypothetical protein